MKTIIFILLGFILFTDDIYANRNNNYINNQNIVINHIEYYNLKSMGFTDNEIKILDKSTFQNNKDLTGEILSRKEYFLKSINRAVQNGYVETEYKIVTTYIIKYSNFIRYKITVEWKKMPYYRSYDIIGIGKSNNVSTDGEVNFVQNFCYKNGNCSSNYEFNLKQGENGNGASFPLVSNKNVNNIIITFFYNIKKVDNSTITKLDAYGDYKHATKNISSTNANKFSVRKDLGIELEQSILNYYDSISIAHATWTGSW